MKVNDLSICLIFILLLANFALDIQRIGLIRTGVDIDRQTVDLLSELHEIDQMFVDTLKQSVDLSKGIVNLLKDMSDSLQNHEQRLQALEGKITEEKNE